LDRLWIEGFRESVARLLSVPRLPDVVSAAPTIESEVQAAVIALVESALR